MSAPRRCDAIVVGAGPAGSATAIRLARSGRRVVVLDRSTFPRDKTCGDGLTTAALRELEALGFDPSVVPSWLEVHGVELHPPTRGRGASRPTRYTLPRGRGTYSAIARRTELDAALAEMAADAGAELVEGVQVIGASQDATAVQVTTAQGATFEADWLVGADGVWSPTRRALGRAPAGYRGEWHAMRQYVVDVEPEALREIHVWFEPDLLPAFVWSFPLADGAVNVGFGVRRGSGWPVGSLGRLWKEILERPAIRDVLGPGARGEGTPRAWPIPARIHRSRVADGRTMWVGDAATATDPLSGEGIAQALTTGRLAAEAIGATEHTPAPESVTAAYEREVHRDLDLDHRLSDWLSAKVLGTPAAARMGLAAAGLNDWTRRNFVRWLFEDYPRALLATPRRWSAHSMRGDGAYAHTPDSPVGGWPSTNSFRDPPTPG